MLCRMTGSDNVSSSLISDHLPACVIDTKHALASTARPPSAGRKLDDTENALTQKSPYVRPAPELTQVARDGICFDFNHGCRVLLAEKSPGAWMVRLKDIGTGNTLFESGWIGGGLIQSSKRWFVRFVIEFFFQGERRSDAAHGFPASLYARNRTY